MDIDCEASTSADATNEEYYLKIEASKVELASAIKVCEKLLINANYIPANPSYITSPAELIGQELFMRIVDMISEMKVIETKELILDHESHDKEHFSEYTSVHSTSSESEYCPVPKKYRITFEKKKKAVFLAK